MGAISGPFSAIGGVIGRQVGKFGERFSASMTAEQKAAGPGPRDGVSERDGRDSLIGGGEPLAIDPPSTDASLTDTGDRVDTRERSSLDIRRRTRPAAFIGPGKFNLGTQKLTG